MKIAFVLTQSLDSPSGLGRFGPVARELAKKNNSVEIIALHHDWEQLEIKSYEEDGVIVRYVGQMHVRKRGNQKTYFNPLQLLWISFLSTIQLTRAVYQSNANVLHLGKPQPYNMLAVKFARRGRSVYCDCDDYEAETNKFNNIWQKKIVRYFEDAAIKIASKLTTNTTFTQKRYIGLGYPEKDIYLIPNGVERARFDKPIAPNKIYQQWEISPDSPLIMYVGTIGLTSHPINLLLEALPDIIQHCPTAKLMFVGGGEDFQPLQVEAKRLGVEKNCVFTGRVPAESIPDYLAAATVSVDPVYDDLTAKARSPLKILESLTMGTPVVTSDVGDRRQSLDNGQFGVLVSPGSSTALAQGIVSLIKDEQLRNEMSKRALAAREQWFWDKLALKFIQVYES